MMVLIDTPVWSLALRRRAAEHAGRQREIRKTLEEMIFAGRAALLGAIRQELLSGIREDAQYPRLRRSLRAFPDVDLITEDYEEAARMNNACRARGIAGSAVDLRICAAAHRRNWPIFTLDRDFV
ncbi:MAG TPA: PIN domain-containing protein [Acidobacteriaceae bacterium]|jgi:hypothetical protein|nr:PIN domain-containing protein [Acidobacteriaceae bacterium]